MTSPLVKNVITLGLLLAFVGSAWLIVDVGVGESIDVKVQMAKNAKLVNALMADAARGFGAVAEPALFTCKRGPDGTITSEPAVVGSAGIEPAIFAM